NIRRQRHMALGMQHRENGLPMRKSQAEQVSLTLHHFQLSPFIENDPGSRLGRLTGAHVRQRNALALNSLDQNLDVSTRFLFAKQARGYHPGVVEYQQITRMQEIQNVLKM